MSDSSFISIQNAAKHFGPVKAVDDVSFDIARGEFFSLLSVDRFPHSRALPTE
jgi:ABC-type Fe3+/spermidine/putrescine transport system ATPase subunit